MSWPVFEPSTSRNMNQKHYSYVSPFRYAFLVGYLKTLFSIKTIQHRMARGLSKWIGSLSKSRQYPGQTEENHEKRSGMIGDVSAVIRTQNILNTALERYLQTNAFCSANLKKLHCAITGSSGYCPCASALAYPNRSRSLLSSRCVPREGQFPGL